MGRIINPSEIQGQANSVTSALEKDEEKLQDALNEIQLFAEENGLQGNAWNGVKAQIAAHGAVIRGLICMTDAMVEASEELISLSGEEDLDEDLLLEQIKQLGETKDDHKESIEMYNNRLKNEVYEFCLGWYARERIRDYENLIHDADEQIQVAKKKLDTIVDIDDATSDLTSEVERLYTAVSQGMEYLKSTWDGSGFTASILHHLPWMTVLNEQWGKNLERKESERLEELKKYHDTLPDELKPYISIDDLAVTDDGFVICKKSMKDILLSAGFKLTDTFGNSTVADYDDWYLSSLVGEKDNVYTIIKLREPTDSKGNTGSSVPFISVDIQKLTLVLEKKAKGEKIPKEEMTALNTAIDDIVNGTGTENEDLKNYFKNPESKGSYLLADIIVDKVAQDAKANKNGTYTYQIPTSYDENVKQCKARLDELEKSGVYNKKDNTITLKDKNNLSQDEKDAILSITTGNPDQYSYAAENLWHTEALDLEHLPWSLKQSSAIKSDAGVGESNWADFYEGDFKDSDGVTYEEQKKYHQED
ncbi:MAG: hypothetical protein RR869_09205 [Lachnospiraceae bacterium]